MKKRATEGCKYGELLSFPQTLIERFQNKIFLSISFIMKNGILKRHFRFYVNRQDGSIPCGAGCPLPDSERVLWSCGAQVSSCPFTHPERRLSCVRAVSRSQTLLVICGFLPRATYSRTCCVQETSDLTQST